MKRFFALFLTILAAAASIASAESTIQRYGVSVGTPYAFMKENARAPIQDYFFSLKENNLINDLYSIVPSPLGWIYGPLLVGRLNPTSNTQISCVAIFCKDPDVLKRLQSEVQGGRLVLVSHDFNGVNAFVMGPYAEHAAIKSYFVDADQTKSPIVVTPSATLDVLEHELVHAMDYEQGNLIKFFTLTAQLAQSGELDGNDESAINRFLLEIRAYDHQRNFVIASHRPNEYVSNGKEDFSVSIDTVASEAYKETTLHDINLKVSEQYLAPMLGAIGSRLLKAEGKGRIISELLKLMPSVGPYSFNELVKPHLVNSR